MSKKIKLLCIISILCLINHPSLLQCDRLLDASLESYSCKGRVISEDEPCILTFKFSDYRYPDNVVNLIQGNSESRFGFFVELKNNKLRDPKNYVKLCKEPEFSDYTMKLGLCFNRKYNRQILTITLITNNNVLSKKMEIFPQIKYPPRLSTYMEPKEPAIGQSAILGCKVEDPGSPPLNTIAIKNGYQSFGQVVNQMSRSDNSLAFVRIKLTKSSHKKYFACETNDARTTVKHQILLIYNPTKCWVHPKPTAFINRDANFTLRHNGRPDQHRLYIDVLQAPTPPAARRSSSDVTTHASSSSSSDDIVVDDVGNANEADAASKSPARYYVIRKAHIWFAKSAPLDSRWHIVFNATFSTNNAKFRCAPQLKFKLTAWTAAHVGWLVGGLCAVLLLVVLIVVCRRRAHRQKRNRREPHDADGDYAADGDYGADEEDEEQQRHERHQRERDMLELQQRQRQSTSGDATAGAAGVVANGFAQSHKKSMDSGGGGGDIELEMKRSTPHNAARAGSPAHSTQLSSKKESYNNGSAAKSDTQPLLTRENEQQQQQRGRPNKNDFSPNAAERTSSFQMPEKISI